MWLSTKYVIRLQSVILVLYFSNALNIDAHSDPCIAKILSCDWYRHPFSLSKDILMFTKIEDLNKACKEQAAYMRCMMQAENFCKHSTFSPMVEEMIKSRRFPAEICRPASSWRQVYLKEASCLNANSWKAFAHCGNKLIEIDKWNPGNDFEQDCKYGKTIVECSATALQKKCGYYAGNLFEKFLKFHFLSEYKCFQIKTEREDVEGNYFTSISGYDIIEGIFDILEIIFFNDDYDNKTTENYVNTNFDGKRIDHLEKQISLDDFNHPLADESLTTTEYSFSDWLNSDAGSQDMIIESDKLDFPALPKYDYIHKNRTTFALYEDNKMGYMKYMGCGEADFFWIKLSQLTSKYCLLTDLKSEYSKVIFKCTFRINAPCSPEIDDEDKSKKAEVSYNRYVAIVLTPPNNQRSEDMAIMNVHYLKLYPSPSMYVGEKKVNLFTTKDNMANIEETEYVRRKGPSEEDDRIEILYQPGNGSGQKKNKYTLDSPTHLDEDDYFEENENWDFYPLEKDDDIYFPQLLTNNIIYIEDDKGDLISLHDHRSPIYSKTPYKPNSLFRPRTGEIPASTGPRRVDEVGTDRKKKLIQRSIFKERVSKFQDKEFVSKVKSDQQKYCSAGAPCDTNSELLSEFGKPGMRILSRTIKTFDRIKGVNQLLQKFLSFTKLNPQIDFKPLSFSEVYVITSSTEIGVQESTESSQKELYEDEFVIDRCGYPPEEDRFATDCSIYSPEDEFTVRSMYSPEDNEFATGYFRYQPKDETYDNAMDMKRDNTYLDPDYSSSVTSAPNSADSKIDYMEWFSEHYTDAFTQRPYKSLHGHTDIIKVNPKDAIHPKNLKAESSTEIKSVWGKYFTNIIDISKALLNTEKSTQQELLDEVLITLLEKTERIFNI